MRAAAAALCCLALSGCGYVGPVVPPSPQIPNAVTDLTVVERGDQLQISFTTPSRTTDNLAITKFSEVDLSIGPDLRPFDIARWGAAAKHYPVPPPPPTERDLARPNEMSYTVKVSDWVGKEVAIGARTAVKSGKNYSSWSNIEHVVVVPPLAPPQISVEATAAGYRITWQSEGPDTRYQILRQGPGEKVPVAIGQSDVPEYLDTSAKWDTPYTYTVTAARGIAQSLPSDRKSVQQRDIFPPAVPSALTALAAADSIELSWHRSPEPDLKGYYVYRSVGGGAFERQAGLVLLPTFSDRKVGHGATYRYAVSAVDQNNNESAKSSPVEVAFP